MLEFPVADYSGGYGGGFGAMGSVWMIFGWIFMILFWAVIILLIVWLYKQIKGPRAPLVAEESALEILKKRYARGGDKQRTV